MANWEPTIELFHSDQWNDITADVLVRDGITITRGQADEQGQLRPAKCSLTLNNGTSNINSISGRYSPRNPRSDLHGLIGRNTPLRVCLGTPHPADTNVDLTDTTDHVAPSVDAPTDDALLLCAWAAPDPAGTYTVPGSMTAGPTTADSLTSMASATEAISSTGATGTRTATFSATEDYLAASVLLHGTTPTPDLSGGFSTVLTGIAAQAGRWWVVISYFGAGSLTGQELINDHTTPVAPSDTDGGGWILLADSGTHVPADVEALDFRMRVWAKRVKTTETHSIKIDNPEDALDSIQSVFWEVGDVDDWDLRFTGEVSSWPPRWDVSGNDRWVPLEAAGITRRLGRRSSSIGSALRREVSDRRYAALVDRQTVVGYWPMEDMDPDGSPSPVIGGATSRTPAVSGPLVGTDDAQPSGVDVSADGLPGSGTLPVFARGDRDTGVSSMGYGASTERHLGDDAWLGGVWSRDLTEVTDEDNTLGERVILYVSLTGAQASGTAIVRMHILVSRDPPSSFDPTPVVVLRARLEDETGEIVAGSLLHNYAFNQRWEWTCISCEEDGSGGIVTRLYLDGVQVDSNTIATASLPGQPIGADWHMDTSDYGGRGRLAVGHVIVAKGEVDAIAALPAAIEAAGRGYIGDQPATRLRRLAEQEGVSLAVVGDPDDEETLLGVQSPETLIATARDAGRTSAGWLYDPRQLRGWAHRTVGSAHNRTTALELDYAASEVAPPLEPTDDDQATRNDVTVRRRSGGQARRVRESGALNVADPTDDPQGVGRYDTSVDVTVAADGLLLDSQAGWRLHLGTVDEARYPQIVADLDAVPSIVDTAAALDVGDRLTIVNPPEWLPPETISQIVLGYTERIESHRRTIAYNCAPQSPYHIADWDDSQLGTAQNLSIAQSGSATLAEDLDTTETAVDIDCGAGDDWEHEVDWDVMIGGERMTVTAVGAASGTFPDRTQTITVTRSVNGITKTHTNGDPIRWYDQRYIGL